MSKTIIYSEEVKTASKQSWIIHSKHTQSCAFLPWLVNTVVLKKRGASGWPWCQLLASLRGYIQYRMAEIPVGTPLSTQGISWLPYILHEFCTPWSCQERMTCHVISDVNGDSQHCPVEEPRAYTEQWEFYFKKKSYAMNGILISKGTLGFESVLSPRGGSCGGGFL